MPLYDFKCSKCNTVCELLVPSGAKWRRSKDCGHKMERMFPLSFSALNTESAGGHAFKSLDMVLGRRVHSVGEQSAVMKELGIVPADSEYHDAAPTKANKEITEKELYEALNS